MARFLPLPLFLALVLTGFQCQPTKVSTSLTGKLVIAGPCGHYTIQILEGSYSPALVDTVWKDTTNDSVYRNVFGIIDPCQFQLNGLEQGDIFSFEWNTNTDLVMTPNCPVCQIFYPTPDKHNAVMNVKKIK